MVLIQHGEVDRATVLHQFSQVTFLLPVGDGELVDVMPFQVSQKFGGLPNGRFGEGIGLKFFLLELDIFYSPLEYRLFTKNIRPFYRT